MDARVSLAGLTATELRLLAAGVLVWDRPARGRADTAAMLGLAESANVQRLAAAVRGGTMSRRDCRRALLATELAFASETMGWSRDWSVDTGFTDRDTITVLRKIQEKIAGIVHGSSEVPAESGEGEPAWEPIEDERYDAYWEPFTERYGFRASVHPRQWPGITEPANSVTFDLGPAFASHTEFSALAAAVNELLVVAATRVFPADSRMVVLDWQHTGYLFWPHRQAGQDDREWPVGVLPNGDYYLFLTEDLTTGTFGHPWERTLCVFGEPLVGALAPLLAGLLPVQRRGAG